MSAMLARLSGESKTRPDASIRRALSVAAFIVCWMMAICVRLVYLQISDHDRLVERAQRQQQFALETGPERGQLLDRHDRELTYQPGPPNLWRLCKRLSTQPVATGAGRS